MARFYGHIATAIWRDEDFLALPSDAQRLYMLLVTQQDISAAGTLPLTVKRWARLAPDTSVEDVEKALQTLRDTSFVVVDSDTEELLARSFIKWDKGYGNPKRLPVIRDALSATASMPIRMAIRKELEKLNVQVNSLSDRDTDSPSDALPDSDADSDSPSRRVGGWGLQVPEGSSQLGSVGETNFSNPPNTETQTKTDPDPPQRQDALRLCTHLADRIEANGTKRPTITRKWRDAARLLIDRDGRTEDQIRRAIDWAQDDEFWRANILSMPKLREKYDQLRLQAQSRSNGSGPAPKVSPRNQWMHDV